MITCQGHTCLEGVAFLQNKALALSLPPRCLGLLSKTALWLRWKLPCVKWNDGELTICLLVCVSHEKLRNRNWPQPWKVMCQAAYLHIKTENEFACYFNVVCVTFRHLSIPLARNSLCSEKVFLCIEDWEARAFCVFQPVHMPDAPCSPGFLLKMLRRLETRFLKNIFVIF